MTGGSEHRAPVPGEQRVFSLVLALVVSPQGATKRELLSSVYGYADRARGGESDVALERQFERDKNQLRRIGIPIDAIDSPLEPGNNQLTRYRISKELLQMPADIRFTERELALLRAAALAWRDGSLTAEARRAAMKLAALGAGVNVQHLGVAPQLGIAEPAAPALQRAIDEGLVARFDYRLPEREDPLERHVAPLALHRADGRWHLVSHDLERGADRIFLLSRITGAVRVGPEAFDPALFERAAGVIRDLLDRERSLRATVLARSGSAAEARISPRAVAIGSERDASILEFGTLDYHALAPELAAFGEDIVIQDPPGLREETVAVLSRIREQHAGAWRGDADG